MNKIIFFSTVSLLFATCSTEEKQKNDLAVMNLKGMVKSIRETRYDAVEKFGEIEKGEIISSTENSYWIFNNNGNIIETNRPELISNELFSGVYGHELMTYKFSYNNMEKITEINCYRPDGTLDEKTTYKYDNKGNKVEKNEYLSDGKLSEKTTYNYDDKGRMIEKNKDASIDRFDEKTTYKYDNKGNKVEKNEYLLYGKFSAKITYKYDDKGRMIEENEYLPDGKLSKKTTYKYDEKGNMIESNNDDFKNEFIKKNVKTWQYDNSANIIYAKLVRVPVDPRRDETDYFVPLWKEMTCKYDTNGNLIEENEVAKKLDGSLLYSNIYKYEYDKNGNWIKEINYGENNEPQTITEREIEYF